MSLLDQVRGWLERPHPLAKDAAGTPADLEIRAATAVLLLEAAFGDEEYVWKEERALVRGLERAFGLGKKDVEELLARANEIRPPVVKLADLTELLAKRFDLEQRKQILTLLWSVIDADEVLEPWEAVFARHVREALGLSAAEAMDARAAAARS